MRRPERAVWEVARVLRPQGVYVLTTNNASEMPLRSPLSHLFVWAEKALGAVRFGVSDQESRSRVFRRSLFVVCDVKKGERLTEENVRSIRPADGMHTRHLADVVGKTAAKNIERGTPLQWDLVTPD